MNAAAAEKNDGDLWLGLDTGGTYTDAVLVRDGTRVIASAKALTTPQDLSVGLAAAIRAILGQLRPPDTRFDVSLVSVSTTLATNAVVENHFSPICTLLIGFDEAMLERSGLRMAQAGSFVARIRGGHDATGEQHEPLDTEAARAVILAHVDDVEAFAVAGTFSVRNPMHELQLRQLIRELTQKPVTCAHELTSKLDAPRRALTAALNARLTPRISHLLDAVSAVLAAESVDAPLMVVKGDGSLMRADVARECPVETILSGPAASVVGAKFLTGLGDFVVSDMGGTTTDIAVVSGGLPVINAEGALVGGWRTMVEAVDVRTFGLGGDSHVHLDRDGRMQLGPRRAVPLSLIALQCPAVLAPLRIQAAATRMPLFAGLIAVRRGGDHADARLGAAQRQLLERLGTEARLVSDLVKGPAGMRLLSALADAGLVALAALTPSDAMHVLGIQTDWNREAAQLGAVILAKELQAFAQASPVADPAVLCQSIQERVIRQAGRAILESALAHDPGLHPRGHSWGPLGEALLQAAAGGQRFSKLLNGRLSLQVPLVAIGAPVAAYYPQVAERLGGQLTIPPHAAVCNAIGAVAGVVSQTVEILVNQPTFRVFRVHDPQGIKDYEHADAAIEHGRTVSRQLAVAAALRAGARDPSVETVLIEKRAAQGPGEDYLAEALIRSTAAGRPTAGHGRATAPVAV